MDTNMLIYAQICSVRLWLYVLTLSWRRPLSYRNQSIDLQSKSLDWFLYDNGLRHERVKQHLSDIRSSIYEKVKQHWGWIEKMRFYKKASSVLKQLLINSPVRKLLSSLVSKTNNQISVLSLIISLSITDPSEVFA